MLTVAHDPHMGTNERRLDMLENRASEAVSEIAERDARRIVAIWNTPRGEHAKAFEATSTHLGHLIHYPICLLHYDTYLARYYA
jgi:hypothetical protein